MPARDARGEGYPFFCLFVYLPMPAPTSRPPSVTSRPDTQITCGIESRNRLPCRTIEPCLNICPSNRCVRRSTVAAKLSLHSVSPLAESDRCLCRQMACVIDAPAPSARRVVFSPLRPTPHHALARPCSTARSGACRPPLDSVGAALCNAGRPVSRVDEESRGISAVSVGHQSVLTHAVYVRMRTILCVALLERFRVFGASSPCSQAHVL